MTVPRWHLDAPAIGHPGCRSACRLPSTSRECRVGVFDCADMWHLVLSVCCMISVCSPSSRPLPGPMSSVLDSARAPSAVEPRVSAPSMRGRCTSFRCADAVVGRCSPRHSVALRQ